MLPGGRENHEAGRSVVEDNDGVGSTPAHISATMNGSPRVVSIAVQQKSRVTGYVVDEAAVVSSSSACTSVRQKSGMSFTTRPQT